MTTLFSEGKGRIISALILAYTDVVLLKFLGLYNPILDGINGSALNDIAVNSLSRELKEDKRKFFVWIHYMSTHFPYDALDYNPTELIFRNHFCNYIITKQKEFLFLDKKLYKGIILMVLEL